MSKEIVKKTSSEALAVFDYGADVGAGFEGQTADELQIPFLALLQALSPQVTGEAPVEGAKPGLLFNTVTQEVYGKSIDFVPACREHVFCRWVPRKAGGGFRGRFDRDSAEVKASVAAAEKFGKYKIGEDDLVETFYLYGVRGEDLSPMVIAFTSTKIKVFRRWNTQLNLFTVPGPDGVKVRPPRFAHRLTVGSQSEKNSQGTFFNFTLTPAVGGSMRDSLLTPDDPRFVAARELKAMVEAGRAKAAYDSQETAASNDEGAYA